MIIDLDSKYNLENYLLFTRKRFLLDAPTITSIKLKIKEDIIPPKSDKKVYLFSFSTKGKKHPFKLLIGQYTLTTKLGLVMEDDDTAITIVWTKDELKKYGWKDEYIYNIIEAVVADRVDYSDFHDNISNILEKPIDNRFDQTYQLTNTHILEAPSFSLLKSKIQREMKPPEQDKKVYIISMEEDKKFKYPFTLLIAQYTLTTKNKLIAKDDDISIPILWTKDDLKKYGWKPEYVFKIIEALRNDEIDYSEGHDFISNILDKN